jgi:putative membrane-bound dehydrogenase-like protein
MRTVAILLCLSLSLLADEFPKPFNTGNDVGKKPMPASEAVKLIEMPPGFKATVFASEPEVQNPIASCWDSRGRLWVAENYTYADSKTNFDKTLRDRILIFEDTDHDGKADKRTVFYDGLQNLTSIELGYGGVYATAAPRLVFIPDKNGDDKPDGEPETLLDGFDAWSVRHNFVNGLKWGPDGWLWGRHGIQATSKVGAPGTPDAERVKINCCIWRYHPVRKTFEVVCWGGTNSWGHDWTAEGEGFFINTVIGHLYHIIPGAHYERMYGQDLNPHIYQLLPQTADHYHFDVSKGWGNSRDGKANDLGGGHAHSGCMIYLGENWPEQYRGKLFTINLHGRRINVERLERQGSGFVGKAEPDMIFFKDPWFRGVELTYGPDGGVYVLDWSDDGECHENDGVHRESGRIYKITYGEPKKADLGEKGDLASLDDPPLVTRAIEGPEWFSRLARRILAERAYWSGAEKAGRKLGKGTRDVLIDRMGRETNPIHGLRALLTAHSVSFNSPTIEKAVLNETEMEVPAAKFRAKLWEVAANRTPVEQKWAIRLMPDWWMFDPRQQYDKAVRLLKDYSNEAEGKWRSNKHDLMSWMSIFDGLAEESDDSGIRLAVASMIRKLPVVEQGSFATYLLSRKEDRRDLLLPNIIWSGLVDGGQLRMLEVQGFKLGGQTISDVVENVENPLLPEYFARYLASKLSEEKVAQTFDSLLEAVSETDHPDMVPHLLSGIQAGIRGFANCPKPKSWDSFAAKASKLPDCAEKVRMIGAVFGDGRALDEIRALVLDSKGNFTARKQGLETLVTAKPADLRTTLEAAAKDGDLSPYALAALAKFDDAGPLIVANYTRVRADGRAGVMAALCSRPVFAKALLDAVAAGKIARTEVTPYHARQIAALKDAEVSKRLAEVWGVVGSSSEQKKARMTELKRELSPEALKKADLAKGREVFTQLCATCHTLYELGQQGTNLGPNLTGSGRDNLDYLLENIVDPSAMVPADYKLSVVTLKDGRVLSGFISAQNDQTLTLRTMTETQTLPRGDVTKTETIAQSLMPEGQLDTLTPEQRRDLIAFLMKK